MWLTGLFALLGVVVGGVVTTGVALVTKAVEQRGERERIRRLLISELRTAFTHFLIVRKHGGLPDRTLAERPESFIPTAAWGRYQERFAHPSTASAGEWDAIDTAYDNIVATRHGLFAGGRLTPSEVDETLADIQDALTKLGHISRGENLSGALRAPQDEGDF